MLHKETVSPSTLELLTTLMKDSRLKHFVLVGGTSLSLQLGHRISVDLDLSQICRSMNPNCLPIWWKIMI